MDNTLAGAELVNKAFYGFRLNSTTGHLGVEVIQDGTDAVVLPQDGFIDPDDYKQWVFSDHTLQFSFLDNGHLLLRIV